MTPQPSSPEKLFTDYKSALYLLRKKLWPYVRKHKRSLVFGVGLVFVSTTLAMLSPWLLGYTVDHAIAAADKHKLLQLALLFGGAEIFRALCLFGQSYSLNSLGQKTLHDIRQALLTRYQLYPYRDYQSTPSGKMVTRLINDTSALQDLFSGGVMLALGNLFVIAGILIWLVVLHPKLGLVCVSLFPLLVLATRYFAGRIRSAFRLSRTVLAELNANLAESIAGMNVVQQLGKEKLFRERFFGHSRSYANANCETVRTFAYFQPTITITSSASMTLLIWWVGYNFIGMRDSALTLGLLVTFMSYLQALYTPIRDLTEKYNLFLAAMSSCEKIFEFLDRPTECPVQSLQVEEGDYCAVLTRAPSIEFKKVCYEPSGSWKMNSLDFTIRAGEKIGLVGPSGAGKSTLVNLILRLFDPSSGNIYIDGNDSKSFDKRALRRHIGFVPQTPFLFSGTIADNLFLWRKGLKDILERLPRSVTEPFLSKNGPLSLDRTVLEGGTNLSSGQAQMIVMMRALVHQPQVLILDEASAHVDSITERWFDRAIRECLADKTCIVIAHRLSTLRAMSRILVLNDGKVSDFGTHEELLKRADLYERLHRVQSGTFA